VVTNTNEWRAKLYVGLKHAVPDSSFVMLQNAEHMEEIYRPLSVPSVSDVLTAEKILEIEQATVGQAENPLWIALRKGRITASNFYKVKRKVESLRKAGTNAVSAKKLVATLTGEYTPPKDLPALKYGREMEAIAKAFYLEIFKKNHKDVKYRECGLFIHETKQFLGASPDLLVECSCGGKGILEVKCPFCIANDIRTDLNLDYLVKINNEVTLKRKHSYYAQVQGQLGVTKREWCHFLVYTKKGYHLERIQLDKDFWVSLQDSFDRFYVNHLKPASK